MRYAQSVNRVVDLVGGEEVGLTCERTEPNVRVRESDIAQVGWVWDEETETFYDPNPEPTFEELKRLKIDELNVLCRKAIEEGFMYDNKLFKSTVDPDQTNIALVGLQLMMDPEAIVNWETADNVNTITLTAQTFPLFANAFGVHKKTQQDRVVELKMQVQMASSKDEISSIIW